MPSLWIWLWDAPPTPCCIFRLSPDEAGVELNLDMANEMSAITPNLCHLAPAGPTYMEDLNEAGGVYAVMNELSKKGPSEPRPD